MRGRGLFQLSRVRWQSVLRFVRAQVPGVLLATVCVIGLRVLAGELNEQVAIEDWLAWRLLTLWGWTLFLNISFVAVGHALLRRLRVDAELPLAELLLGSFVAGLALFGMAMFGLGALGGFNTATALLLPGAFLGLGALDLPALHLRIRDATRQSGLTPLGGWQRAAGFCASGIGALLFGLLYLQSLNPANLNFDAVWYHVPIAQDYAREGGLVPFYGDDHRAFPHLASLLHTWALLVPGVDHLPLRWVLMLHIEYSVVLWRAVAVVAGAQWLLKGRFVPGLWASFWLFPSVFIYDQNIAGSADHLSGVSTVPAFLALGRALPRGDLRYGVLLGVFAGAHILTKYQAVYLVVAIVACVVLWMAWLALQALWIRLRGRAPRSERPLRRTFVLAWVVLASALFVSGPHFIKNTVFYDNPVYPFARKWFPSEFERWERPQPAQKTAERSPQPASEPDRRATMGLSWSLALSSDSNSNSNSSNSPRRSKKIAEQKLLLDQFPEFRFPRRAYDFSPKGDWPWERLVWAHETMVTWSFETGNRNLTKLRPYMGSLFTLLLPTLLFLGRARRLWFGVVFCYWAFLTWALTSANDRYLLSILSLVAALTAALMVRVFQAGWLPRMALILLVGLQLLWNADVPFTYGSKALKQTMQLVSQGYSRPDDEKRFTYLERAQRLTREFPEDALILGRYYKELTGLDRATLNTHRNIQRYIPFGKLKSVHEFWEICVDRGVTHLMYPPGQRKPEWAQDIVLFDALAQYSERKRKKHGVVIAEISKTPPPLDEPLLVLTLGMLRYADGLHPVARLSIRDRDRPQRKRAPSQKWELERAQQLLDQAGAALILGPRRLGKKEQALLEKDFTRVERFGSTSVWVRKRDSYDVARP